MMYSARPVRRASRREVKYLPKACEKLPMIAVRKAPPRGTITKSGTHQSIG
jgi:hypothetical protein